MLKKIINGMFRTTSYFLRDLLIYILIFTVIGGFVVNFVYNVGIDYKEKVLQEYNLANYVYQPALKTEIYSRDNVLLFLSIILSFSLNMFPRTLENTLLKLAVISS